MEEALKSFSRKYQLSKREYDVLTLLATRVVNNEHICNHLGIHENTVRIHIKNMNCKLNVRNRAEILSTFIGFLATFYDLPQARDRQDLLLPLPKYATSSTLELHPFDVKL